jgi:hypothetical protein
MINHKIIQTNDFFGEPANFEIIWETVKMTCTFAVGIQTDKRNEFSIFHVTNLGGDDIYTVLDTGFLDVYQKYGFSVEEKVKKEMAKVITRVLTARFKAGQITIKQIERWAENERL